ncbi:F0F1 ATP synthase subunit A [Sporolactobacillus terrae]|uniref:ATP synthase subunit a n=1 Tax=Sporolactobacillus terrae TaxID=269673 RepID=A0A410DC30_9BACL|nr:F0F1 ATP synthase subunit A [Sporolactobacillus terrae]QAA23656.1 ATP synthase F0 subunit A [Sporolactobacillus terrae]QAA26626.1 ATP synthase F0 subunit A [Sporolactobacillus terrae]UAK15697.1 F0F1 ATP synthase subunit A [Sporolactobacillus terrae]BBO00181.1 ATP synthase subunit a [Sporolactobacillus terrae]
MDLTPKVKFLGMTFDVTLMIGSVVSALIVMLIVFLLSRRLSVRPSGRQNVMEYIIDFISGITGMMLEKKESARYLSFALSTFLFILVANMLGVIVMITAQAHGPIPSLGITAADLKMTDTVSWFKSPTSDINVTVAMAGAIFLYSHFAGIAKSPLGYLQHYVKPYWWMLPIHIIDEVSKPATHALRLWANIFAGEVLILILREGMFYLTGVPLFAWMGFSLFVGCIQAYIFTVLAMVYIAQKVGEV